MVLLVPRAWKREARMPADEPKARPAVKSAFQPGILIKSWSDRRARARRLEAAQDVFPQSLEIAIQALRAGQTLPQTLEYLSEESAPPLREEFAAMVREMAWGSSAEQAIAHFAERVPSTDVARFRECYRLSRQTGANLAQLLQTLCNGMEERHRLARRMTSMTAQARLSGILMGCLPFFMVVILTVMDPALMSPLFTTLRGYAILGAAALLEVGGFLWIRSLMVLET
jgi:tight adherence protein B